MKNDYITPQTQIVRMGNNNLLGISFTTTDDKPVYSMPDGETGSTNCSPETTGGEVFGDAKKGSTARSIWDNWDE